MKLRLYHHPDGARVAYREAGTGPPLALLHSKGLSHREWEPVVDELSHRHRVVLPDLPLHGDSEDRPRHPVHAGLVHPPCSAASCRTCAGRGRSSARTGPGALLALRAIAAGALTPEKLVLTPSPMHRRPSAGRWSAPAG